MDTHIHSTTFINQTDLPIIVEGWILDQNGEGYTMKRKTVKSGQETKVLSSDGGYSLSNHFDDQEHNIMWSKLKHENQLYIIGDFRIQPDINGHYSFMETDVFNVIYENNVFKFVYNK